MSIIQAIILGILQGLSEFLPISSTAHLTFAGKLMGLINPQHPEQWTAFIAVVQLGTLLAVLIYFYKELINIPVHFVKENFTVKRSSLKNQSNNSKMGWFIIIGTMPIVTIGIALKKVVEGNLTKDLFIISISLIALAIILAIAERVANFKKEMEHLTWKDALFVGLAQCLALIPGASRSGTTITAGLFLGLNRETAARFSFILSIPAVLASGLLEFYQSLKYINNNEMLTLSIATIFAAISGYLTIGFLLKFLKSKSTMVFVYYRLLLGAGIIILLTQNFIKP